MESVSSVYLHAYIYHYILVFLGGTQTILYFCENNAFEIPQQLEELVPNRNSLMAQKIGDSLSFLQPLLGSADNDLNTTITSEHLTAASLSPGIALLLHTAQFHHEERKHQSKFIISLQVQLLEQQLNFKRELQRVIWPRQDQDQICYYKGLGKERPGKDTSMWLFSCPQTLFRSIYIYLHYLLSGDLRFFEVSSSSLGNI